MNNSETIHTNEIIEGLAVQTLSPISAMKPQQGIIKGAACFFPVEAVRFELPADPERGFDARPASLSAVINAATGQEVGRYKKGASLVSNEELVQLFEAKLSASYDFEAEYTCFDHGARFEACYTLKGITLLDPDGLPADLTLTLRNSYDGAWKMSLGRKVRRLVCLNGMESITTELALAKRHSARLDLSRLAFKVDEIVNGASEEMSQFNRMAGLEVKGRENILKFLGNTVRYSKQGISKRLATRMAIAAIEGDSTDPEAGTLWALYNAGTRVIRDLAEIRPEAMTKAGKAWSNICVLAANPQLSGYARGAFAAMLASPDNACRLIDVEAETE